MDQMNRRKPNLLLQHLQQIYTKLNLRNVIWISFTVTGLIAVVLMGLSFYGRFSSQMQASIKEENASLIEQIDNSTFAYLRSMMKVSDALNYNVIKKTDLSKDSLSNVFQLLYDTNKDNIQSIALFSADGKLLEAAPASALRENVDIRKEEWYQLAADQTENVHFSRPMVEHLFVNSAADYYEWVIPLSRTVQVTYGNQVKSGVLLINLYYTGLEDLFGSVSLGNNGYLYLMENSGRILYHPQQQLINSGVVHENNLTEAVYKDGNTEEVFNGQKRSVTIKTVGYTGWKIVGVTPVGVTTLNNLKSNLFFLFLFLFFLTAVIFINSGISYFVAEPIHELENSVNEIEKSNFDVVIQTKGFAEVQHLGSAIQKMADHIKDLMHDIVVEHEEKRKTELNALQSQINPHFLYNTLDIIVWMIENGQPNDAVKVVTALARFFRISLSKGKVIITAADELEHVRNYLTIQEMRYKNKFHYTIESDPEIGQMGTIKLILQPMVENSIYHAMEFMDGDGQITIKASHVKDDLIFSVKDNGCGMTQETVDRLLNGSVEPSGGGSGVGVKNVQERIKLYFGQDYGLDIHSEPDEGTEILIRIPAVPYDELRKRGLE